MKNHRVFLLAFVTVAFAFNALAQSGIPRIVINPKGHSAKIHKILFTPDGERIISVSEDKTIRLWNAGDGELLNKFESQIGDGSDGMLYAAAISPNGKLLAVSGYPVSSQESNYIIIIDIDRGEQVATAIGHNNVINGLSFTGDGKYLLSGGDDGLVKIWRMDRSKTLKEAGTIDVGFAVSNMSVNPKLSQVAIATQSRDIWVYDFSSVERNASEFPLTTYKKHKEDINRVAYSPDGKWLASSSFGNELALWKTNGELEFIKDNFEAPLNAMAFSFDGRVLVALDITGRGYSYSIPAGTLYTDEFNEHDNVVFTAAFSPQSTDGNYVIASAGGTRNEIIIWNAISAKKIRNIRGKGSFIGDLAFGTGMELFVSQEFPSNKVKYHYSFDFNSMTIRQEPGKPKAASYRNLSKIIKGMADPFSIELNRGKMIYNDEFEDGQIRSFAVTNDDNIIVGSDFSLKLYDSEGNILKEFLGHTGGVWSLATSPDGRYFASGSDDQTIKLWKLDESGHAPSMRQYFEGDEDAESLLSTLEMDSLLKEESKQAWKEVIRYVSENYDKRTTRFLQDHYNSLGETVIPFAHLFIADDSEWICWAPTGYFGCSSSGADYFGWHINNGIEKLADFYSAEQYFEILYRPKVLSRSIASGKRVKEILLEEGEKIFDLSKLSRPSAGFFNLNELTIGSTKILDYNKGKYLTTQKKIPLTVDIFDGGGGIREVNIYHNGKLIIHDTEVKSLQAAEHITKTYDVDLVNETNNFRVVVINYQGIESRPDYLKIEYTGEQIVTSTLHILSIGINQYERQDYNLNYAQSDALSFTRKFIDKARPLFKNVRNKIELYDAQATKENILKGFESIISQARPEDMFVFYYAGHGTVDETDNNEYYLVPPNITELYGDPAQLREKGISSTELKDLLSQVKSTQQLILMDACHSGAIAEAFKVDDGSRERAITQLARSSGVAMLTSSNSQQFATEFDVLKHGVFTYSLLEALDGAADTGDNQISVYELKLYMERVVPQLSQQYGGEKQRPVAHVFGNDFPVALVDKSESEDGKGEQDQ